MGQCPCRTRIDDRRALTAVAETNFAKHQTPPTEYTFMAQAPRTGSGFSVATGMDAAVARNGPEPAGTAYTLIPDDILQAGSRTVNVPRLDTLDIVLFLPCIWIAASLGFAIGDYPILFFIMPPLCLGYAVLRGVIAPRLLAVYVGICIVAGFLSARHLFPQSWQIVFLEAAIPRQLAPIISFFAVAWAAKAYFLRRIRQGNVFANDRIIIVLAYIVAPAIMFISGVQYEGDDTTSTILAAYGSFINSITLGLFFLFGHLFYRHDQGRYFTLFLILLVAFTTHFVQFKIISLAAIVMLIGFPPRLVIVGVIAAFMASYAIQALDVPGAVAGNPDKGIRVAFIVDSFESLVDTSGVGIGYGTESVRWVYRFPGQPDFTFMPNPATISDTRLMEVLSRGVHNSFIQAMLRLGVIGLILMTAAIFCAFPPAGLPRPVLCHASMLFVCMFVACFVNPALESPRQLVGIGFSYGYLLALRSTVRRVPHDLRQQAAIPGMDRSLAPA